MRFVRPFYQSSISMISPIGIMYFSSSIFFFPMAGTRISISFVIIFSSTPPRSIFRRSWSYTHSNSMITLFLPKAYGEKTLSGQAKNARTLHFGVMPNIQIESTISVNTWSIIAVRGIVTFSPSQRYGRKTTAAAIDESKKN